ncbi:MAG: hypothetical protein ACLQJ0_13585 [Steroidobacteraceae bacterium]|jgi:hypothetical protein
MHAMRFGFGLLPQYHLWLLLFGSLLVPPSLTVAAGRELQCPALEICYCVDSDFNSEIAANVVKLRHLLGEARKAGRLTAYISVPISGRGGGYFPLNLAVAASAKRALEDRFGADSFFALSPGTPEATLGSIPTPAGGTKSASGSEYMRMWTEVLAGVTGRGEEFDLVYFVGPSDVAQALKLTGHGDLQSLHKYVKDHADDPAFRASIIDKGLENDFVAYYGFRGSVTMSYGSHDEWNIFQRINSRRRADPLYGFSRQVAVYFDGRSVDPASTETAVSPGSQSLVCD